MKFPEVQIEGATPINDGAAVYLPPVGVGSVPLSPDQVQDTLAYLRRRIADAGRRADRATSDASYEDAQRDITMFSRRLANIATRTVDRVPSQEV